ncbi:DHH family phosphoesterase [Peribacillus butanolivorans]|uniref:DHH family phosphoesterase n=1 Tax=Peribacillus butanolivorans TaxID=421767 RepID=A0AAX0S7W1_9BACI|nr:bifunctional oligoribonuclease/PAP phosphatase NrnA [Peribacillus butanolivorans]PEJ36818.1 DHH family phosphoesterase [Peribacillus butanolivorans]QNU05872.1 bifunctional oligoribonuclease/PAP phosphatase NrnA [Peribacillus butanolivorans]
MENIKNEIVEAIKKYSTIIIHRHINPDPDAIGSQVGLQQLIKHSYPSKEVYVVGEEVDSLLFISKMEVIPDKVYKGALVIVCDTSSTSRISDSRYTNGDMLIKIDHHPEYERFGDLSWVDPSYSSASEMLVDLFLNFPEDFKINKEAAKAFYAGIISDTGRFLNGNTSPRTLKTVSLLRTYNFQPERIHNLLNTKTKNSSRLQKDILMSFKVTDKGVAYFIMTKELLNKYGVDRVEASNLVNTLSSIKGNKIWAFFIEYPTEIRVRIRSRNIPISSIARQFNGGGHSFAAGATIHSWEEVDHIIEALNQVCPK